MLAQRAGFARRVARAGYGWLTVGPLPNERPGAEKDRTHSAEAYKQRKRWLNAPGARYQLTALARATLLLTTLTGVGIRRSRGVSTKRKLFASRSAKRIKDMTENDIRQSMTALKWSLYDYLSFTCTIPDYLGEHSIFITQSKGEELTTLPGTAMYLST